MKNSIFMLLVFSFLLQSCDNGYRLIFTPTVDKIYKETDASGAIRYYCYFSILNSASVSCKFSMEDHNDAIHFQLISMDYLKGSQPVIYHELAANQIIEVKYEIKNWSGAPGVFDSIKMMALWVGEEQHDEEKVDLTFSTASTQAIYYVRGDDIGNAQYFHAIVNNYLIPGVSEPPPSSFNQVMNSQVVEIYNPNDFAVDIFVNNNPPKANCPYDGALRDDASAKWLPIPPHQSTSGYGSEFQMAYPTSPCMNALAVTYIYSASSQWTTQTDQTKWIALRCITK